LYIKNHINMAVELVDDSSFNQKVNQGKVVVKFFADWCGSCKLFAPKFKRLSNDERFKNVSFLEVNAEISPDSRKQAGVNTLPYFVIYKDGKLIEGVSSSKEEVIVELIQKIV